MIEAWFGILTKKSIRRASFDTVRALIRHIERYIDRTRGTFSSVRMPSRSALLTQSGSRRR